MPFEFEPTDNPDVLLVTAGRFEDARGYFLETFREAAFHEHGIDLRIVQVNESVSCARHAYGVCTTSWNRTPRANSFACCEARFST